MKKVGEISCIVAISFFYMGCLTKFQLNKEQIALIINYSGVLIRVVCTFAAMVIAYTNLCSESNYKATHIAICYFMLNIPLVLSLYFYNIGQGNGNSCIKLVWLIRILELGWLYISIFCINTKKDLNKWLTIEIIVVLLLTGYFSFFYTPVDDLISRYGIQKISTIVNASLIIVLFINIIRTGRFLLSSPSVSRKFWNVVMICQLTVHIIQAVLCVGERYQSLIFLAMLMEIISCVSVPCFISEYTLKRTWKRTDEGIANNRKQLNNERFGNRVLMGIAKVIQEDVKKINIFAEHFKESVKEEEQPNIRYIDKIINNCNRLTKLNQNILELNQIDKGSIHITLVLVDLTSLVERLVDSIEPYIKEKGLEIECRTCGYPILCYIDAEAIERVLLNLISNAIKYNSERGRITVYVNEKNENIYLCVEDTGVGVPSAKIDKMFERYERGDSSLSRTQEGSGLGLAIVKSIIDIHHGEIKVKSKENRGTQFSITLPKCNLDAPTNYVKSTTDQKVLEEKIKIELSDV